MGISYNSGYSNSFYGNLHSAISSLDSAIRFINTVSSAPRLVSACGKKNFTYSGKYFYVMSYALGENKKSIKRIEQRVSSAVSDYIKADGLNKEISELLKKQGIYPDRDQIDIYKRELSDKTLNDKLGDITYWQDMFEDGGKLIVREGVMFGVGFMKGGEKLIDGAGTVGSLLLSGGQAVTTGLSWLGNKFGLDTSSLDKIGNGLGNANAKLCGFIETDWSGKVKDTLVTNNPDLNGFHSDFLNKNIEKIDSAFQAGGEIAFDIVANKAGTSVIGKLGGAGASKTTVNLFKDAYSFVKNSGANMQDYLKTDKVDSNKGLDRGFSALGAMAEAAWKTKATSFKIFSNKLGENTVTDKVIGRGLDTIVNTSSENIPKYMRKLALEGNTAAEKVKNDSFVDIVWTAGRQGLLDVAKNISDPPAIVKFAKEHILEGKGEKLVKKLVGL